MIPQSRDYRETLKNEYEVRVRKNPRYSLRAFARFLGISQSRLSQILNYKQGLSRTRAEKIGERLGYSVPEIQGLADMVDLAHSRNQLQRKFAAARLAAHSGFEKAIQLDAFEAVADWCHYGITELALTRGFRSDPVWIAKKLGVDQKQVEIAIERLLRLGLLTRGRDGRLRGLDVSVCGPDDVQSEAIKKYHSQILNRAAQAIYFQPVTERNFSSSTFSFRSKDVAKAQTLIRKFVRSFSGNFDPGTEKDSVFCLATQFFRLDHEIKDDT
jgi:uncharacterized protein (TIGR02147 family)